MEAQAQLQGASGRFKLLHTSNCQHLRVILGPKVFLEDGWYASASRAGAAHVRAPPRLCDAVPIKHKLQALHKSTSTHQDWCKRKCKCHGGIISHSPLKASIKFVVWDHLVGIGLRYFFIELPVV